MIRGGNGIVDGLVDDVNWTVVMETMESRGFRHLEDADARLSPSYFAYLCSEIGFQHGYLAWYIQQNQVLIDLFAVRGSQGKTLDLRLLFRVKSMQICMVLPLVTSFG